VREAAAHKPDFFKIWVDDVFGKFPKMDPAVFKATIEEAHRNGIRVASHVFYLADAKELIGNGVDALAHSIRDQPVDRELVAQMKKRGTYYVSTFTVDESAFVLADRPAMLDDPFLAGALSPEALQQFRSPEYRDKVKSDPNVPKFRAALANGMRNLKTLHDAGVRIAFGLGCKPGAHPRLGRAPGVGADGGGRPQADGRPCRRDTRERRDARSDGPGNARAGKTGRLPGAVGQPPGRRPEHEAARFRLAWRSRDPPGGYLGECPLTRSADRQAQELTGRTAGRL